MPLISVIMPFRNSEKYLESAIKSVLGQTYENFELILCNDSSEDRSVKIVQHFNDRRIIYLRNSKQMGISASRNLCLMHSKGTYIAVLDSDDISLPFRLERQLAFMERNTDNILCGTHFIQFNEKGLLDKGDSPAHSDEEIRSQFIFSNCILHSSLMFRRTIGSDIKYDESMEVCEDFDLIYRLGKLGKMTVIPETMTYYRLHKTNTIFQQKTKMDQFKRIMFERVLNDWNIDFSAEEMQIHTKFLLSDKELFCTPLARYSLENWIRHLEDQTRYNSGRYIR